jgi:hypothetical protein
MKNYRTIELPDCCGMCGCFEVIAGLALCSRTVCKNDFIFWESVQIKSNGLCDNFKRSVSQNAKDETQTDLSITDETQKEAE